MRIEAPPKHDQKTFESEMFSATGIQAKYNGSLIRRIRSRFIDVISARTPSIRTQIFRNFTM